MTNPTIVTFNMENREVIEGFKSVDASDESDVQSENAGRPVFNSCMGVVAPLQTVKPVSTTVKAEPLTRRTATTGRVPAVPVTPGGQMFPQPLSRPNIQTINSAQGIQLSQPVSQHLSRPNIQTIQLAQPVSRQGIQTIQLVQPAPQRQPVQTSQNLAPSTFDDRGSQIKPIISGIDLNTTDTNAVGVGIPVEAPNTGKFSEPTIVGIPTINTDNTVAQPTLSVGAGKQVRVLNGRTYLAR